MFSEPLGLVYAMLMLKGYILCSPNLCFELSLMKFLIRCQVKISKNKMLYCNRCINARQIKIIRLVFQILRLFS